MTMHLTISHSQETTDDSDPVYVIGNDRAVGGRILPAKDGVEYSPAAAAVELRIAELMGY